MIKLVNLDETLKRKLGERRKEKKRKEKEHALFPSQRTFVVKISVRSWRMPAKVGHEAG